MLRARQNAVTLLGLSVYWWVGVVGGGILLGAAPATVSVMEQYRRWRSTGSRVSAEAMFRSYRQNFRRANLAVSIPATGTLAVAFYALKVSATLEGAWVFVVVAPLLVLLLLMLQWLLLTPPALALGGHVSIRETLGLSAWLVVHRPLRAMYAVAVAAGFAGLSLYLPIVAALTVGVAVACILEVAVRAVPAGTARAGRGPRSGGG